MEKISINLRVKLRILKLKKYLVKVKYILCKYKSYLNVDLHDIFNV